jgi:hypothetical protein
VAKAKGLVVKVRWSEMCSLFFSSTLVHASLGLLTQSTVLTVSGTKDQQKLMADS